MKLKVDEASLLSRADCADEYINEVLPCEATDFAVILSCWLADKRKAVWYTTDDDWDGGVNCIGSGGKFITEHAFTRYLGIRPILKVSNLNDVPFENAGKIHGMLEVEYGEYPQYVASSEISKILDEKLTEGQLEKTGKTYTVDARKYGEFMRKFAPWEYDEYIYDNKKYIRVYSRYNNNNTLSDGSDVKSGDYVWLEVSPIKWYVHPVKNIMISKVVLASGVRFCVKYKKAYFKNTDMYKFLNEYFIKDIVPSKVSKKKMRREMAKSNIDGLMLDIHEYLEGNPDKDKYLERLSVITDKYNKKIDELMVNKEKGIPSVESYKSVTTAFELELNMFLVEVKRHHETYKEYFEMMALLDEYIKIINGKNKEEDEISSDLAVDLTTIVDICLPFLKDNDADNIKKEIIDIIDREKKEIANYIDGNGEITYKTVDEMNLDLRRKIHPVLGDLSTSVNKRDVEVEIRSSVRKIIDGLFDKPKNEALSFYLVEINNVYTNINALIDKLPSYMKMEYKSKMLDIMNMNIDYSRDFNDIASDLKTMWLSLNRVLFRIKDYLDEMNEMREGHVDVKQYR